MSETPVVDLRDATAVAAELNLTAPEVLVRTWPQSERSFALGRVFFLDADWVRQACADLGMSAELTAAMGDCAAHVAASAALQRLAWHLHWLLVLSGLDAKVGDWPAPGITEPPAAPLFYGLIALSGLPHLRAINAARGISEAVTVDTLSDIETWAADFHAWEGVYRFHTLGWLQHHLRGQLYKLGRLEYVPGTYGHPFRWYRHAGTGKLLAVAEGACWLRGDGQFASADGAAVTEGRWETTLTETRDEVTAYPVAAAGYVCAEPVTLYLTQWQEVLRQGDPVMTVHIPSRGRMGPEECGASFTMAVEFYKQHFPEVAFRAFTCHSWLLDPQFDQLQPPPPNICAFMREWYLHPAEGADERQTWQRVFDLFGDWNQRDWNTAAQNTSLQRSIVSFAREGKHLRGGGGVIFAEDLDWGRQGYRTGARAELPG